MGQLWLIGSCARSLLRSGRPVLLSALTADRHARFGRSALPLLCWTTHGQQPVYAPGRTVHTTTVDYRGEAKTNTRDAYVIADACRLQSDLTPVQADPQLVTEAALLTAHRSDLVEDRVRMTNRLRTC